MHSAAAITTYVIVVVSVDVIGGYIGITVHPFHGIVL